jgi:hypothetical protein
MRTFLISTAVAVSALAVAAPASAQWYPPQQQGYGYGYGDRYGDGYGNGYGDRYGGGYGNGYGGGYGNGYGYGYDQRGGPHRWAQQLDRFRNDVRNLSARGLLTRREVQQSNHNIHVVERALRKYSRDGFNQREAWDMERRLSNLQVSISRHASDADTRRRRYR